MTEYTLDDAVKLDMQCTDRAEAENHHCFLVTDITLIHGIFWRYQHHRFPTNCSRFGGYRLGAFPRGG